MRIVPGVVQVQVRCAPYAWRKHAPAHTRISQRYGAPSEVFNARDELLCVEEARLTHTTRPPGLKRLKTGRRHPKGLRRQDLVHGPTHKGVIKCDLKRVRLLRT